MNAKEKLFMEQLMATKFYVICLECVQEIDVRDRAFIIDSEGNLLHESCPRIKPKYT